MMDQGTLDIQTVTTSAGIALRVEVKIITTVPTCQNKQIVANKIHLQDRKKLTPKASSRPSFPAISYQ